MTEQFPALLTPHGEGPRKGGLKIARFLSSGWLTAGHQDTSTMQSTKQKEQKEKEISTDCYLERQNTTRSRREHLPPQKKNCISGSRAPSLQY